MKYKLLFEVFTPTNSFYKLLDKYEYSGKVRPTKKKPLELQLIENCNFDCLHIVFPLINLIEWIKS